MARIAERAEQEASYAQWANRLGREQRDTFPEGPDRITQAITHAAWQAAIDIDVDAIICCTRSRPHGAGDGAVPAADRAARACPRTSGRCGPWRSPGGSRR